VVQVQSGSDRKKYTTRWTSCLCSAGRT
jgi:hypothetical protein